MAFSGAQHRPLRSQDIIDLCKSTPHLNSSEYGNRLVRISEEVVVKFGLGVRKQEADNQVYARRFVDKTKLYIPQVLLFFEAEFSGCIMGFLVMEYVHGVSLESVNVQDRPDIARRLIGAVQHLATIPMPPISLAHHPLRMCHMDLVRRNILLLPNSSLCFVDWAFAGFFPSLFEAYNFRELLHSDKVWFQQLLDLWPEDDDCDEQTLRSLGIIASVNMKFFFPDAEPATI